MGRHAGRESLLHVPSRLAMRVTDVASSAVGLTVAVAGLASWVVVGAASGFPAWWHTALNAAGWVLALLMLFLLQHAQRKDTLAIQLRLNELVRAVEGASDRLVAIERLDHEDLAELRRESERQRTRDAGLPPARGPAKP